MKREKQRPDLFEKDKEPARKFARRRRENADKDEAANRIAQIHRQPLLWVKLRKVHNEHIISASSQEADIAGSDRGECVGRQSEQFKAASIPASTRPSRTFSVSSRRARVEYS
jgi:hypothetical protein